MVLDCVESKLLGVVSDREENGKNMMAKMSWKDLAVVLRMMTSKVLGTKDDRQEH
jgi:hypothetical protein